MQTKRNNPIRDLSPDGKTAFSLRRTDIVAVVVFFLLFGYLFYAARFTILPDDSYWVALGQRLAHGDRLIADEWQPAQFFSVVMVLPYVLFTGIVKSTTGIVLFMRYLHLVADMAVYVFLYVKLRRYTWRGLLAVFCFCSFFPGTLLTPSYYATALKAFAVVCSILCLNRKMPSPAALIFAGCLLSVGVLCEPLCAAIYLLFAVLVFVKARCEKKNKSFLDDYSFILDKKVFWFLSIGVAFCAVSFLSFLAIRSGIGNILQSIPKILQDPEYNYAADRTTSFLQFGKLAGAFRFYGLPSCIGGIVLLVLSIVTRFSKKPKAFKLFLFCASAALLICAYVYGTIRFWNGTEWMQFLVAHNAPPILFGLICYILCDRKDRRMFVFWLVGFLLSVCVDAVSDVMFGMGGVLSLSGTLVFAGDVLAEIKDDAAQTASKKKRSKTYKATSRCRTSRHACAVPLGSVLLSAALLCVAGWECTHLYCIGPYPLFEKMYGNEDVTQLTETLDAGPLKGIRASRTVRQHYDDTLADLDRIRENSAAPVFVAGMCPYAYLYLDLPIGAYSAWWDDSDTLVEKNLARQLSYWQMHPERIPEYVYVPKYGWFQFDSTLYDGYMELYASVFNVEAVEGKAGYYFICPQIRDPFNAENT